MNETNAKEIFKAWVDDDGAIHAVGAPGLLRPSQIGVALAAVVEAVSTAVRNASDWGSDPCKSCEKIMSQRCIVSMARHLGVHDMIKPDHLRYFEYLENGPPQPWPSDVRLAHAGFDTTPTCARGFHGAGHRSIQYVHDEMVYSTTDIAPPDFSLSDLSKIVEKCEEVNEGPELRPEFKTLVTTGRTQCSGPNHNASELCRHTDTPNLIVTDEAHVQRTKGERDK